jgi:hypothetical protein
VLRSRLARDLHKRQQIFRCAPVDMSALGQ